MGGFGATILIWLVNVFLCLLPTISDVDVPFNFLSYDARPDGWCGIRTELSCCAVVQSIPLVARLSVLRYGLGCAAPVVGEVFGVAPELHLPSLG